MLVASLSTVLAAAVAAPAGAAGQSDGTARQWQLVGPNASGGHLAFTPAKPSRLYVLPDRGDSVYRTDDHGLTWRPGATLDVPGGYGGRIAADPRNADVVYVTATGSGGGSLMRSDDGARTFHAVLTDPGDLADVVVAPTGRTVFTAGNTGVFASDDNGRHWRLLPGGPAGVSRIALSGHELVVSATSGIYVIDDALGAPGAARRTLTTHLPMIGLSVDGDVLLASGWTSPVELSTDSGRHWHPVTGPWGAGDAIPFTGVSATGDLEVQTIAGAADGTGARNLWVSGDLGRNWSARPAATPQVDVYTDLGGFPDRPRVQVVAASAGIYTTRDAVSFHRIGVPDTAVNTLTMVGPALVAGTMTGTYGSSGVLRKNLPAAYQDWGPTGPRPTVGNSIGAVVALPGRAAALRVRNAFCGMECIALESSHDGGATWQTLTMVDGMSTALALDPADPSRVYVGSYLAVGVYVSEDGGKTLVLRQPTGLTGVTALAADPRVPGGLWIGDQSGLYLSADAGSTARKVIGGEIASVVLDPADSRHIVIGGNGFLKVSRDGGQTFTDAVAPSGLDYDAVTFAPDGTVFAGSRDHYQPGQGVLRSADGGVHWTSVATGLPNRDVHALLVSPDDRWVFAGTGAGVYRLPVT